jgi:xanthine dehydrogenase accessory factor
MDTVELIVLRSAREWLKAGCRVLLATVVKTWGSSPRPVGSMMALREDGRAVGSVSGGCIEDDLIYRYTTAYEQRSFPELATDVIRYGIDADEAHRFGLPCGGTLELVLEFLPSETKLDELIGCLERGELVRRTLLLSTGRVSLESCGSSEDLRFDGGYMSDTIGPEYRILLIGAGVLAEYVSTMALFNGFSVTVCDPRSDHAAGWSVAGARVVTEMPDDAVIAFRPDQRSCIVALSHDPKLDDLALIEALRSPAFYVGAIGSRRNNNARRDRLMTYFGETEESLKRLRGPIGIYIGSKTPSEIAVSVMAEILAVKNGISLPIEMSVALGKRQGRKEERKVDSGIAKHISHFFDAFDRESQSK